MSISLMVEIFKSPEPKGAARLVLLAIADNANDEGVCWPSVATIARKAALDDRRCQRIIKELVEAGYLSITRRHAENGVYSTNIYKVSSCPTLVGSGAGTTGVVAPVPPGGGAGTTGVVAPVPPESSFNHHVNPDVLKADDEFSRMQAIYQTVTGNTVVIDDIQVFNRFIAAGVIKEDIEAAIEFYKSQNKVARSAAQIERSVMYSKSRRIQAASNPARQPSKRPQSSGPSFHEIAMRQQAERDAARPLDNGDTMDVDVAF